MHPPYDTFGHDVLVEANTPLGDMLDGMAQSQVDDSSMTRYGSGNWLIAVNSYHHQAVRTVAPTLSVMATATDGVTEAVYRPESRFLWAVQWHPEFLHKVDARSRAIFRTFVDAARR